MAELKKYQIPLALSLVGLVLIFGGGYLTKSTKQSQTGSDFPKESLVDTKSQLIVVDISGAVNKAGVVRIADGARLEEIIAQAGGFTEDANQEYISKYLNLAQKVSDGAKIYVPFQGEQGIINSPGQVAGASTQGKVNINQATQAELEALSGIGPSTAQKIIGGRPYQKIEDLQTKKIVPKATFEKLKESLGV